MIDSFKPLPGFLNNRVILITGASRGIGAELAKTLAQYGATVVLLARTISDLEKLYDEIVKKHLPTPAIYPLNLASASPKDYQELSQSIASTFDRLDAVIHNAAHLGTLTPIEHYPAEQWYEVLQVNLNSAFLLTQATLPLLKKAPKSSLIFTTANEGITGKAYWGAYGVSKFGIQGLMQTLAEELEINTTIRVNAVNPGSVKTRLRREAYPSENPKHLIQPTDMMKYYLYLLSEAGQEVHGQIINAQQETLVMENTN